MVLLNRQTKPGKIEAVAEALITGGDAEIDAYLAQRGGYLPRQSTEYYDNTTAIAGSGTTVALVADRLYAVPYFVPEPDTVERVYVNVTTTGTATELRYLVYACDATTGRPGALIATLGTASIGGTTGTKLVTGLSRELAGDAFPYVWLVVEANGTVTVSAVSPQQTLIGTDGLSAYGHVYVAHTYANAAPDPFGTGTRGGVSPRITVRIA